MKFLSITILLLTTSLSLALTPTPAAKQEQDKELYNATVHVGNGKVIKNARIVFSDGKISVIESVADGYKSDGLDLQGQHIYPGFILPNTDLGLTEVDSVKATIDSAETGSMNPNVRSLTSYNTDSEKIPTLRFNGILLAQSTPKGGLVSGISSIVQLDAWNWEDAVVKADDALHINWPSRMTRRFDFATFSVKTEKNKKHSEQIGQIQNLFEQAKLYSKNRTSENLKLEAVSKVFSENRKVYVHTDDPKAIIESINYLKSIGVEGIVLVAAQGVEPVIDFIKSQDIPVIVAKVHDRPKRDDSPIDNGFNVAVKLHEAGVLTAIGYPGSMSSRNLPFVAGTVVSYGLDKETAIQMLTQNTAKILGIDKHYGTLEKGKSATFIVTKGDVMDMRTSKLSHAFIDGRELNLEGRQQRLNNRFLEKYGLQKP